MGGYYDWCLLPGQDGMTYDAYEICGDCLDEEPTKVSFILGDFNFGLISNNDVFTKKKCCVS